ncbi:MAG TPA: response regulator [Bryobacteraceae bacterium]|nr:response regulator [Bryobacteraceae bacterium]
MRALIVDDEPLARKVLREELEVVSPDLLIAGEAADGEAALAQIHALRPDIVFLDLQMPGLTGFDVVRNLDRGTIPVIIIVTAYDKHAIEAFEAGAIDYLLKPVNTSRLSEAVQRAERLLGKPGARAEHAARLQEVTAVPGLNSPRKIVGRLGEEYFLLRPDDVLAFQADGDVVWIVTAKQRFLATMTLRALQEKLKGLPFHRVHRNALVNLGHIRKMAALSSQRWLLTLQNNQEFIVSKRQAQTGRQILDS